MKALTPWCPPPPKVTLSAEEVHVWRALLDCPSVPLERLLSFLPTDERARADSYCFARDRKRFIVGRGLLRALLGSYVGMDARRLTFRYGRFGKPALTAACGGTLAFNLSHSHGLALYAVTRGRNIGIDIERIRAEAKAEEIAERFFSPAEIAVLRSLPVEARRAAFFACWTRKEAYVKAQGGGLSIPLNAFQVAFAPGTPAALLTTDGNPAEAARWTLRDLNVGGDYAAALAADGPPFQLHCWDNSGA